MQTVYLHGRLRNAFGHKFRFEIANAGEAFRALNCAFPGRFVAMLREGAYEVIRGDLKTGFRMELDHLNALGVGSADLHIVPVARGSSTKGTGTVKAIAGIAIVGAAIFFSGGTLAAPLAGMSATIPGIGLTYGNFALFGLGVALMGVSQVLAKTQASQDPESKDTNWTFSGPVSVSDQGAVVPLIYGRVITAGRPISAGFDIEDTSVYDANSGVQTGGFMPQEG